ncbi:GntR family transcriptional regulator [Pelagovum pacificum]|uniref:GntR family transcriptional regulator n=1 Tax=Pelagovum pacificum TaxID=2588711 RepID=A0A5C5G8F4_9RHOB|nr:GntR family transcriptional regulator [Pelagovum pacificum]QQA41740.1 GntR family transcriptional regulator [Pelagovum pacificum]TNY31014.1 GntR family transcriptional regulator [Pelagovum pacificum]
MAFDIDPSIIDKSLPVPVGRQLYGLLSYQLSHGDIPKGTRLPSVRRLASDLGIAQVTVAQVYQQLRDAGLLEMRKGSGAFTRLDVPDHHDTTALKTDVDLLLSKAERMGIAPMALVAMVSAQAQMRRSRAGLTIIFVGVFEGPGNDYVAELQPLLTSRDRISLVTLEQLRDDTDARAACEAADLVLTFVHRKTEVAGMVPGADILGLRFIPSDATRAALARIDPRARVAAITQLRDYIAIMRPSVQRFAPHVSNIQVSWSYAPELDEILAGSDVVIYASGADHIARAVRPGVTCFEYRHAPDPAAIENELLPYLAALRETRARGDLKVVSGGRAVTDDQ